MHLVKINTNHSEDAMNEAVKILRQGGIVACPTESSYGLCARYDGHTALERIFALKGQRREKPFPLIIGSIQDLLLVSQEPGPVALKLAQVFWPGPLTLLLPAKDGLSGFISKEGKVAVRVPGPSFALELVKRLGLPLTATSANPSGLAPATSARAVLDYFGGGGDLIIDGGSSPGGPPSTIVDVTGADIKVLREGAINSEQIKKFALTLKTPHPGPTPKGRGEKD